MAPSTCSARLFRESLCCVLVGNVEALKVLFGILELLGGLPSIPNRPQKARTFHDRTIPSTSTVPCARAQAPFTNLERGRREEPRIPYRYSSPRTLDVPFHRTIRAKHTCLTHNRGNSQGNLIPSFLWQATDGSTCSCGAGSLGPTCILGDYFPGDRFAEGATETHCERDTNVGSSFPSG